MPRIAIYTRLSHDVTGGNQTATHRQEVSCRAMALSREWDVQQVFEDADLSAYRKGVRRPAFEHLMDTIQAGEVNGVLVWKLDRLVRRPAEFERFWAICENAGAFLASVTEPIDSSSEMGLAMVRILVTFAGLESTTKSIRLRAKAEESARAGGSLPGPTPYGHTARMTAVQADEAQVLQDVARRLLGGETLRSVVRHLNNSETVGPNGPGIAWSTQYLRKTLSNPRMAGDRAYRGVVVHRDAFPPILDRAVAERVAAMFAARSRRHQLRERLLVGLARCGRCGREMRSYEPAKGRYYRCARGCHLSSAAAPMEQWVTEQALPRVKLNPSEFFPMGANSQRRWSTFAVEQQRQVLVSVIECVEVLPSTSPGSAWRPTRVLIRWRFPYTGSPSPEVVSEQQVPVHHPRPDTMLDLSAAAARAGGITTGRLRSIINTGALPASRIENRLYVLVGDLDDYLAAALVQPRTNMERPTGIPPPTASSRGTKAMLPQKRGVARPPTT